MALGLLITLVGVLVEMLGDLGDLEVLAVELLQAEQAEQHQTLGQVAAERQVMLEVLEEDYVRTAHSKGLSESRVIYVHALRNALIAPFTSSNTARSAGTIFPIVSNIPHIYGSEPGPTAKKIGTYVMWCAFAATAVTSSLFLTALAPNVAALAMAEASMISRD